MKRVGKKKAGFPVFEYTLRTKEGTIIRRRNVWANKKSFRKALRKSLPSGTKIIRITEVK